MTHRRTGPGRAIIYPTRGAGLHGRLFNFDVDGAMLKPFHRTWLSGHIVPILAQGGRLIAIGLTSRTASEGHNFALSEQRVSAVVRFLREQVSRAFPVTRLRGDGESHAMIARLPEHSEDEWYRAVIVTVSAAEDRRADPVDPRRPEQVERIIHRTFRSVEVDRANPTEGQGDSFGDVVNFVRERFEAMVRDPPDEVMPRRPGRRVPLEHQVNRVTINRVITIDSDIGVTTTTTDMDVQYDWGVPRTRVIISLTTTVYLGREQMPNTPNFQTFGVSREEAQSNSFLVPINIGQRPPNLRSAGFSRVPRLDN